MDSLGIYISVPFCRSKCTYCNFASDVHSASLQEPYVSRLCQDIRSIRQRAARSGASIPRRVESVYFGGGTPSVLAPRLLCRLWQVLLEEFEMAPAAEITLECAPGQLEDSVLDAMLESGLNRVSFGVQSFVDREAAVTGRLHTREIVFRDLHRVMSAGVERVNIDLIAGLPHQTPASWKESLDLLLESGVEHASVYMLEVDEDSRLGRELLAEGSRYHAGSVPGEDLTAEFYEMAIASLEEGGIRQYEISNFARPGGESSHNLRYWRRQPYLGFGVDAHSHLCGPEGTSLRFQTSDSLDGYLGAAPLILLSRREEDFQVAPRLSIQELSTQEELEEAWFLGLRLRQGVRWDSVAERFGPGTVEGYRPLVDELCDLGLLLNQAGVVRLTRQGMLFSNDVFARFLGEQPEQFMAVAGGQP